MTNWLRRFVARRKTAQNARWYFRMPQSAQTADGAREMAAVAEGKRQHLREELLSGRLPRTDQNEKLLAYIASLAADSNRIAELMDAGASFADAGRQLADENSR